MKLLLSLLILVTVDATLQLCSYAESDTTCATSLLCQNFNVGVCTKHTSCDQTGICYGVIVRESDTSDVYRVKNYLTVDCPQSSFALEAQLTLGDCEQEVVGNYTYYARLNSVEGYNGDSNWELWFWVGLIGIIIIIVTIGLLKIKKLCCWKPQAINYTYSRDTSTSV